MNLGALLVTSVLVLQQPTADVPPALERAHAAMARGAHAEALTLLGTALLENEDDVAGRAEVLGSMATCQWVLGRQEDARTTLAELWFTDDDVPLGDDAPDALRAEAASISADLDRRGALALAHTPPVMDNLQVRVPVAVAVTDALRRVAMVRLDVTYLRDGNPAESEQVLLHEGATDGTGARVFDGAFLLPSAAVGAVTHVEYTFQALGTRGQELSTGEVQRHRLEIPLPPLSGWVPSAVLARPAEKPATPLTDPPKRSLFGATTGLAVATMVLLALAAIGGAGALGVAVFQIAGTQVDLPISDAQREWVGWAALPFLAGVGLAVAVVVVLAAGVGSLGLWGFITG